jgi:hypothetical protein
MGFYIIKKNQTLKQQADRWQLFPRENEIA